MEQIIATYSIVARDPNTGELAIGVQSKFLAVGSAVPWAQAGTGAVATQAWANVAYGPTGLALLAEGLSAQEVVDRLVAEDEGRDHRQLGVVDSKGNAAAYTGAKCMHWAGHHVGDGFTCQGNILVGEETVSEMARAYTAAGTLPHLADRMIAALAAAQSAGGDSRGKQSAALYVVREKGGYGGFNDRLVDLRVDDHPEPIEELRRLLALHRQVWLGPTPPAQYTLDSTEKVHLLQSLLRDLGVYDGAVNGEMTFNTRGSLATYCAEQNLEAMGPSGEWLPGATMLALRGAVLLLRSGK
ncbi:MAG: hypothetical protein JWN15_2563 [Firmicutes bacterium]|nr:hypothetical protein [Bacillota bacterium]